MSIYNTMTRECLTQLTAHSTNPHDLKRALVAILPTDSLVASASELAYQSDADTALVREAGIWRITQWEDTAAMGWLRVSADGITPEERIHEIDQLKAMATASEWAALESTVGPLSDD